MNSNINRDNKKISLGNLIAIFGIVITLFTTGIHLIYSFYQNGRMSYYQIPFFKMIQNDSETWFFINILFILLWFLIPFYLIRKQYLQKRKLKKAFTNLNFFWSLEIILLVYLNFIYLYTNNLSIFQMIINNIVLILMQVITYLFCKYLLFEDIIKSERKQNQLEYFIEHNDSIVTVLVSTLLIVFIVLFAVTLYGYLLEKYTTEYYTTQDRGVNQIVVQTSDHKAIMFEYMTNNDIFTIHTSKFTITDIQDITLTKQKWHKKIIYNDKE